MTSADPLAELARSVLGRPDDPDWAAAAARHSFVALGGDSMRAISLVAQAESAAGLDLDLSALLGGEPLTVVLAAARPVTVTQPPQVATEADSAADEIRPVLPTQGMALLTEQFVGGSSQHVLDTAEIRGPLDTAALRRALDRLPERHDLLRTVFAAASPGEYQRRVLRRWRPALLRQTLPPMSGGEAVEQINRSLGGVTTQLLDPFQKPPYLFVLTEIGPELHLLSLVAHAVLMDGWGIGVLWRDLAAEYERALAGDDTPVEAVSTDAVLARVPGREDAARLAERLEQRTARLADLPSVLELPGDLTRPDVFDFRGEQVRFALTEQEREACEALAARAEVTRTVVLIAAWALTLSRRSGMRELILGTPSAQRGGAEVMASVANCAVLMPLAFRFDESATVREYLRATAAELADAVSAADVPFEDFVHALGGKPDNSRIPLTQALFSNHYDLVPDRLRAGGLDLLLHEGHCRGTTADATLYAVDWSERPKMALEYATSVVAPYEAADLADSFRCVLAELAEDADRSPGSVRGVTERQRARLRDWGRGPEVEHRQGLWQLLEQVAAAHAEREAVSDPATGITLTYRQLIDAATAQAARLTEAGVREGDRVVVGVPRSAAEVVAVLAALRSGAAYVGLNPGYPPETTAAMLRVVAPRAVVGDDARALALAEAAPAGCVRVDPVDLTRDQAQAAERAQRPAPADPERTASLCFTSGSTGTPKAVRVPHRGMVRLVLDRVGWSLRPEDRYLRLAPLSFDVSTLELFLPLTSGAAMVVHPERPLDAGGLAGFFQENRVSAAVMATGLFRLLAEHRPDAFAGVRHVVVGGDVLPPEEVRVLLARHPGFRVSNAYGPSENTLASSIHHLDHPAEVESVLPIGVPISGTGLLVLDEDGGLVSPGAVGELHLSGAGQALDYAGDEQQTARAFGRVSPLDGERLYRTGDLARWDGQGRLRFLGRRDHQVKVRGYRIELDSVRARLARHPAVRATTVATVGDGPDSRRIIAAVIADRTEGLVAELRRFAAEELPGYAVPTCWAVLDEFPVTVNGKIDTAELLRLSDEQLALLAD